jgi:dTDP-4-amino-4,6-dideoxygalactose transaminase
MRIGRTLPPTAAPIGIWELLRAQAGIALGQRHLKRLEAELKDYFHVRHVFLVSSGKAALTLILTALASLSPKRQILIPAYTCFSVPSAIVKAGLEITLCDVDPESLDFDFRLLERSITQDTLCVVPTHLLGLPSDIDRVKAICGPKGVFVVEDAAQAMGGKLNGGFLGTLGDVGFFSFGRGKNIACGSGGVILTNSDRIAAGIRAEYAKLKSESPFSVTMGLLGILAMRLFIDPRLYWIPASLPFLKLGETHFYKDFPMHRLSGARASVLLRWAERLENSNAARRTIARELVRRLPPGNQVIRFPGGAQAVPLRFPLLMASRRAKNELCVRGRVAGLGITPLYPTAISAIPELRGRLARTDFPAATLVADRLVTLPVHPLVREEDLDALCALVNACEAGPSRDIPETAARPLSRFGI